MPSPSSSPDPAPVPSSSSSFSSSSRLPYYSLSELALHNLATDCWVSFFGSVYNLTALISSHPDSLSHPLIEFAGCDITHWFDQSTREPKTYIDQESGIELYFLPHGRYIHIPPADPLSNYSTSFGLPWWRDPVYRIGLLSGKPRKIRLVNLLSGQSDLLQVCDEESLEEIQQRYLSYNKHARSYTWKRLGKVLDMKKTLEENGMKDETQELAMLNLNPNEFIPTIHVYFNDDLTVE